METFIVNLRVGFCHGQSSRKMRPTTQPYLAVLPGGQIQSENGKRVFLHHPHAVWILWKRVTWDLYQAMP